MISSKPMRLTALAVLSVATVAAGGLVPITVELSPSPDGSLQAARVSARTSLWGAAFAQNIRSVTLNDIAVDLGTGQLRFAKAEVRGASLPASELTGLFGGASGEPVVQRLARLDAKEVVVPELTIEQNVGGERQTTRYRNVVATDLAGGRIASLTSDGATFEVAGKTKGTGTLGRTTIGDLDLAELVRLYAEKAGAEPAPLKRIYGAVAIENVALKDEKGVEVRVARVGGKDFLARPTKESWAEMARTLTAAQAAEKPSEAETQRIFALFADLLGAFQVGSAEATGFELRDPTAKEPVAGRIARLAYTGASAVQPGDMRAEGLEVTSKDGTARVNTIAFTGFSLGSTTEGLRALASKPADDLDAADFRKLAPTIGAVRVSGIDFDGPSASDKGPKPERIRFGVGNLEVTADKPVNGVPTNLRFALDNMTMAVPANSKEDGLKELAALGYRKLDLSFATAASWNEPGNELVIRDVSLRGAEMGSVSLRGVFGNVGKDVFDADSAVAAVALVGATLKNADLTVENRGLFERYLAQEAKKQKRSAEELRREYGMAAAIGVPALLGNSGAAKTLGQAVARFVAKPGRLVVGARTKDPAGLGVGDVAALGEPAAILDKLEVTAVAE